MSEVDAELNELAERVSNFAEWLRLQFDANCDEDDYTEGCLSCDSGMAIKHLNRIGQTLKPTPITEGEK